MSEPLPYDIILVVPPLVGTFGRAEMEHAAALIVRVCQVLGDRWQPVSWEQVQQVLQQDIDNKVEPFAGLSRNPFFSPDVHALIAEGHARMVDKSAELTDEGRARLLRWRRAP